MSLTQGQLDLMRHVADTPGAPNVMWPDGPAVAAPRYVMQASGGAQTSFAGTTNATPEIIVSVETEEGDYAATNSELVALLVARFPLNSWAGNVFIETAPLPRPPVPGPVYSVPVIITGRYFF